MKNVICFEVPRSIKVCPHSSWAFSKMLRVEMLTLLVKPNETCVKKTTAKIVNR